MQTLPLPARRIFTSLVGVYISLSLVFDIFLLNLEHAVSDETKLTHIGLHYLNV